MRKIKIPKTGFAGLKEHWKDDLRSGFNVSLIALPLCLGIALASGFPPIAGLFAAIVGGLLVSRINGSYMTITGPAAGLIVVNMAAVEMLGEGNNEAGYKYALAAILISGVFITIFGLLKVGKLGDFFPASAVHGMLAAIGVIIIVKQLFVGVAVPSQGHEFYEYVQELPHAIRHGNPYVIVITVVSLLILIFVPKIKLKIFKLIPTPIWVIAVAIPLEFLLDFEHDHQVLVMGEAFDVGHNLLVHLPTNPAEGIVFPDFSKVLTSGFWLAVMAITLVTTIESMLSALAVDSLDPYKRKSNLNRDVSAMGIGSTASSAIGGLPMISEIVRSSANITNGAKTQWANFFHGGFLLLFVLVGAPVINHIPLSALAAMLIFTGFRLASPKEFIHSWMTGKSEFIVFISTLVMVLVTDILIGIAAGIFLSLLFTLLKGVKIGNLFKILATEAVMKDQTTLHLNGSLTFANYLSLKAQIKKVGDCKKLVLDMQNVQLIDHSTIHHLHEVESELHERGLELKWENDSHLNPVSTHPTAERNTKAAKIEVVVSEREKELTDFATKHEWTYAKDSLDTKKWQRFPSFLGKRVSREYNVLTKELLGTKCTIADVEIHEEGIRAKDIAMTAMHINLRLGIIPQFTLEKESLFDTLSSKVVLTDIDFEKFPEFSDYYLLKGEDKEAITAYFNEPLIRYLEANRGYHIESNKKGLLIYKHDSSLKAEEIIKLIEFSMGYVERST